MTDMLGDRSSSEQKEISEGRKGSVQGAPNWWIVMNRIYVCNANGSFLSHPKLVDCCEPQSR
jgi:hypothetical protein